MDYTDDEYEAMMDLAAEIRAVDGNHDKGASELAEALMPWVASRTREAAADALRRAESLRRVEPGDWMNDA